MRGDAPPAVGSTAWHLQMVAEQRRTTDNILAALDELLRQSAALRAYLGGMSEACRGPLVSLREEQALLRKELEALQRSPGE